MRKIPSTMATQHPDNAAAPFWDKDGNPFVSTQRELIDCMSTYRQLDMIEYMWDWEGKYADASIVDKLYGESYDYFAEQPLGKDTFLTFRLPNIWEEKGYSLLQAMTVMLSAEDFAKDLGFKQRPLFEIILPMTTRSDQLIQMHNLYSKLAQFKNDNFNTNNARNNEILEMIPLVEGVNSQMSIGLLLQEYIDSYKAQYKVAPSYMRPFIACSDPALSSGWLSARLANLDALSQIQQISDKTSIPMYPIIGVGGLPFRGGLTPNTAATFHERYPGVRTVTIQSSFRFDYPIQQVKRSIKLLEQTLPHSKTRVLDDDTTKTVQALAIAAEQRYQTTLQGIAGDLQRVFAAVPRRRERRLHIGLLAYGRSSGTVKIPRAITYTAGLYSIGAPPEFIGLGRSLKAMSASELELLRNLNPHINEEIDTAGRYINIANIEKLAKRNKAWSSVLDDITYTQEILGIKLGPRTHAEKSHQNITSNVLLMKNNQKFLTRLIEETAILRKSLG